MPSKVCVILKNATLSQTGQLSVFGQDEIKKCIAQCEKAVDMVNMLHLFSSNESIEEVAGNEIKYLLLPALLGYFCLKNTDGDRTDTITKAQTHYIDFIKLCRDYELTDARPAAAEEADDSEQKPKPTSGRKDLRTLEKEREAKMARFREKKARDVRLKELQPLLDEENVDEHVKREYWLTLTKQWIDTSLDDLQSIQAELEILQHMAKLKTGGASNLPLEKPPSTAPRGPFIITKDRMQKEVFGLGYPSVPTYTIDEFYEQQVRLGQIPTAGSGASASEPPSAESDERRDRKKEEEIERDDPEALAKARQWDDWKDDHRRGWGNTYNKG